MFTGKLSDHIKVDIIHDAGTATAYDGPGAGDMVDMRDYDGLCIIVSTAATVASATNLYTGLTVESNSASDGSGTDTTIATAVTTDGGSTTTLAAADFGDTVASSLTDDCFFYMDVRAEQMPAGDRYLGVEMTGGTGTLPFTIIFIRYKAAHSFKDMVQGTRNAFQLDA